MLDIKICVIGLGYVGLPLSVELGKHYPVIGYDIDEDKVESFTKGMTSKWEVDPEDIETSDLEFTTDPSKIKECNFIIVCVPTPIDSGNKPDFIPLKKSTKMVGENLKKGSVVVYESTVYPGLTEELCAPILEKASGFKYPKDFKLGYSPERINPGDKDHLVKGVVKVVSGCDKESLKIIDSVYSKITKTYKAPSLKVAEAAKMTENIQRDLNIALVNELAIIYDKLGVNIHDVLDAAGTKWNFHHYKPGLVGGHCIPVDPYYLIYRSDMEGYHPDIISSGRRVNNHMHRFYAEKIVKKLIHDGKNVDGAKVIIFGLTFKPDVADYRNTRVKNLIHSLKKYDIEVLACDPMLEDEIIESEFGVKSVKLDKLPEVDLKFLAVNHKEFKGKFSPDLDIREI